MTVSGEMKIEIKLMNQIEKGPRCSWYKCDLTEVSRVVIGRTAETHSLHVGDKGWY